MAARLFIAEKPSLGRTIAEVIGITKQGEGYLECGEDIVTWCFGHVFEQAKPEDYDPAYARWSMDDLPIVPVRWEIRPKPEAAKQIAVLKKLLAQCDTVVHAGDPDREGQLLVDEVLEHFRCRKPVLRLWLQDLTPSGVRKALASMRSNDAYVPLREAALARSRADWLIGMNMTRAYTLLWRTAGGDGALHIGRVQTPTLGLVVRRDREIEAFVPTDFYTGWALFEHAKGRFAAKWVSPEEGPGIDPEGRVLDPAIVQRALAKVKGKRGRIEAVRTERKRVPPPLPYTLADLQKEAHKVGGLSPQATLDVAQALYEKHKLITYPRSDCPYLPVAEHARAGKVVEAIRQNFAGEPFWGEADIDLARRSGAWDDGRLGAHHGIIPTAGRAELAKLTQAERLVYRLIARRYLAQFCPAYEYDSTSVTVGVEGERFVAHGQAVVVRGWRVLVEPGTEEGRKKDAKDDKATPWGRADDLPSGMAKSDPVTTLDVHCKADKTRPPARFDGATLIEAMQKAHLYVKDPAMRAKLKETQGIGTEATRAGIIQNLLDRGYIEARKKAKGKGDEFVSTPKGRALIDAVDPRLAEVDLTAWFEGRIEGVLERQVSLARFEEDMVSFVRRLASDVRNQKTVAVPDRTGPVCPACGRGMVERTGKHGRFWGCRGYPECTQTLPFEGVEAGSGKPKSKSPSSPASSRGRSRGTQGTHRGERLAQKPSRARAR